jgi:hypothetical protein
MLGLKAYRSAAETIWEQWPQLVFLLFHGDIE